MIYRIREPFAYNDSRGVPRIANVGDLIDENHDAYTPGRHALMEPIETVMSRAQSSETATAAPGERRSVTPPPAQPSELEQLRKHATELGVKVDGRWSLDRLRQEIDAAESDEDDD